MRCRLRPARENDERILPGGNVHVSAVPVLEGGKALGFVVLLHDLNFVERREASTREFLLMAFGFLALSASAVTIIAARLAWRGWMSELRTILRGDTARPEFQPILRDVRELVDRIVADKETDRSEPIPAGGEDRHPREQGALHSRQGRGG
jgi:trehalose 6-phosphate synthase